MPKVKRRLVDASEISRSKGPKVDLITNDELKDDTELLLESALFGTTASATRQNIVSTHDDDDNELEDVADEELFHVDSGPLDEANSMQIDNDDQSRGEVDGQLARGKSAWRDEADEKIAVSLNAKKQRRKLKSAYEEDAIAGRDYERRLRSQYERMNPTPSWAADARKNLHSQSRKRRRSSTSDTEGNAESETPALFTSTADTIRTRTSTLPSGVLSIERLRDANQSSRSQGHIHSVEFHPNVNVPVLSLAGADRRLRLFNIDGHLNPHLQTVHIPTLPLTGATYHPTGSSILLTGPRPFYYVHDLQSGATTKSATAHHGSEDTTDKSFEIRKFSREGNFLAVAGRGGQISILDWNGGAQTISRLKANSPIKSLWWDATSTDMLWSISQDSMVYVWDMRSSRCLKTWTDDGGYGSQIISGDIQGKYLATGSRSGYVNVYDLNQLKSSEESSPKPLKSIGNLTTQISSLGFNTDSQMIYTASESKKEQMRLIHLPSLTAFSNWPTASTPLGIVRDVAFSPDSRYVSIANGQGCALLYRLHHFST